MHVVAGFTGPLSKVDRLEMNLNCGGFLSSFEEGTPRRSNKWIAALTHLRGRGGQTPSSMRRVFDLPRRAVG